LKAFHHILAASAETIELGAFNTGFDRVNLHRLTTEHTSVNASTQLSRAASDQGLTLIHFLAQRKHILWDTSGA
jgi:hypothetical protein